MNTEVLELYLPIDPADIPSAQHKGAIVRNGRVMFFEKTNVKNARKIITSSLIDLAGDQRCEHSAYCATILYVFKPKSLTKKMMGKPKTTRPDLDNITKLMLDAITDSHVAWGDDSHVSTLVLSQRWAKEDEEAYIYIRIEADTQEEQQQEAKNDDAGGSIWNVFSQYKGGTAYITRKAWIVQKDEYGRERCDRCFARDSGIACEMMAVAKNKRIIEHIITHCGDTLGDLIFAEDFYEKDWVIFAEK